jgi:hypothetical protein
MLWKWKEARPSGSSLKVRKHLNGGTFFNVIIIVVILVVVGWATAVFSAPYLRKNKLEHVMGEYMREYKQLGERQVYDLIIKRANEIGIPGLTDENIYFDGDINKLSTMRIKYKEAINLPGGNAYVLDMEAECILTIPNN